MNGVLIIDKPGGWTSHDVVSRVRRIFGQRSVGHLGTLDPLATGVLPLVLGNFTRLAQFYTASQKTYEGVIRFGFATTTYDADGDPVGEVSAYVGTAAPGEISGEAGGCFGLAEETPSSLDLEHKLNLERVRQLAAEFTGKIEQMPPPFSAKKIHGVPAYKLARKHKEVDLKPVSVEIEEFSIASMEKDRAHFRARVSSGTYIRSIAHDLGQRAGCGAHLASLRRTAVAEFDIGQAYTVEEIENPSRANKAGHPERSLLATRAMGKMAEKPAVVCAEREAMSVESIFVHPRQLLPQFPCVTADEATAGRIRHGRPVNLPELSRARHVKVFSNQTDLIAIATRVAGSLFHPKIVLVGGET